MSVTQSQSRLRAILMSLSVLAIGHLPTDLEALPADSGLEICGFERAGFRNLMLPVLPNDPCADGRKKVIVFDLLISTEGELIAKAPYFAPSRDYLPAIKQALDRSVFEPALECDQPVSGLLRHSVTDYFYPTNANLDDGLILPHPLWSLDRYVINKLDSICRLFGDKEDILIKFQIDANGNVTGLDGTGDASDALIDHFFGPLRTRLTFTPATRSGEPVESQLTLHLSTRTMNSILGPAEDFSLTLEPMPLNPYRDISSSISLVTATLEFDSFGVLLAARVDPETPSNLSQAIMVAVRSWTYLPKQYADIRSETKVIIATPSNTVITCQFVFLYGEEEAFLLEEPKEAVLIRPKLIRSEAPIYPSALKNAGVSGQVEASFIVDATGRVYEIKINNSTHPEFSQAAVEALKEWRFEPTTQNGEAVPSRVYQVLRFNLR